MRVHFPELYQAHRARDKKRLTLMAAEFGLTYEQFEASNWDHEGKLEMAKADIDTDVPMPEPETKPKAKPKAKAKDKAPAKKRGRPKGATTKPPENTQLLEAVEFIGVVENDTFENSKYAKLSQNYITAYSNVLAAGYPIAEEIELCPQIEKLKAALTRCGRTLAITETEGGQISIKGDRIRATVPCLAEPLAIPEPDPVIVKGDFNIIKKAFKACNTVADDKNEKVMYASVLLDPNTVSATNGMVLLQYWHGIANLPPATVVPAAFAKIVSGQKMNITGFGGMWDADAGLLKSLTVWFENGAWLKTQCFEDRWQDINSLLNVNTEPTPVPEDLFEAVAAVEPFCSDTSAIIFSEDAVQSHRDSEVGAVYNVKGLPAGKIFSAKLIKQVAPYVETLDLLTHSDRAFFFGGTPENPVRGVFMGMTGSS
jgi:hypothetical protein